MIHLILSQEITDILTSTEPDTVIHLQASLNKTPDGGEVKTVAINDPSSDQKMKPFEELAMKVGGGNSNETEETVGADG